MEFLLECIGFPPGTDLAELAAQVEREGEPTVYRGPGGLHRRLPLAAGLELRLDRDEGDTRTMLWPHYQVSHRLRVAVERISPVPDQPFDALLSGRANPPLPMATGEPDESYPFATYVTDARRIPRTMPVGHVLAVSAAGFALDVARVAPDGDEPPAENGPRIARLRGDTAPGGCLDLSVRIRAVRHIQNPITRLAVELIEAETPGRPTILFASRWQLEQDGLAAPRPGWRIEGCFVFTGRVAGGLPSFPEEPEFG